MSNESNIIVKDACILFDLIDLDLLDLFFQLDYTVVTTQAVINEVTSFHQREQIIRHLNAGDISIDSFSNDEFIFELHAEFRGLSLTDCSVIDLAYRRKGMLLTADKSVRKVSKKHQIEVHGIVWIIEVLVIQKVINYEKAIIYLQKYLEVNNRAPRKNTETLIERFKNYH